MKWILIFILVIPFSLIAQKQDSIINAINFEVELIEKNVFNDKFVRDTIKKVNEEYEQHYIVAYYENKKLRKVRVDNGDGAAGDISSGKDYYFLNGELILMQKGSSYFMAGGCSIIDKIYFNKTEFIQLITRTDCTGENAKTMHDYFGDYVFNLKNAMDDLKLDTELVPLTK